MEVTEASHRKKNLITPVSQEGPLGPQGKPILGRQAEIHMRPQSFHRKGKAGQSTRDRVVQRESWWQALGDRPPPWDTACGKSGTPRLTALPRYCVSYKWKLGQGCQRHLSNGIHSFHVSVSHFSNSGNVSSTFMVSISVVLICGQWLRLPDSSDNS